MIHPSMPTHSTVFTSNCTQDIPDIPINASVSTNAKSELKYARPWGVTWVLRRLKEDLTKAIGILDIWVHKKRWREVSHETLEELRNLKEDDALAALEELSKPKRYIRGGRGNQMNVPIVLSTLDDQRAFDVNALHEEAPTTNSRIQRRQYT